MPSRRALLQSAAGGWLLAVRAPAIVTAGPAIVQVPYGVQVGDVVGDRAIIWAKADRARRACRCGGRPPRAWRMRWRRRSSDALEDRDFIGKIDVDGLPAGQRIFYEVSFVDLGDLKSRSLPAVGSFVTPPRERRDLRFVWSGDTAGQGWGINPDFGGMRIYEAMRRSSPTSSSTPATRSTPTTRSRPRSSCRTARSGATSPSPEKSKVAETLRRVPQEPCLQPAGRERPRASTRRSRCIAQWDDHDVTEQLVLGEAQERRRATARSSVALLAARAHARLPRLSRRPGCTRSSRTASSAASPTARRSRCSGSTCVPTAGRTAPNRAAELSPEAGIIGQQQLAWLMQGLQRLARDLEGDRLRHADRAGRLGRLPRQDGRRGRGPGRHGPPQRPRARVRGAVPLHPRPERSRTSSG